MKSAKYILAHLILLLGWRHSLSGQQLHDVFSNQAYDVRNYSKDYLPDGRFVTKEIDIVYANIKAQDSQKEFKLNEATLPLCMRYIQDPGEFTLVLNELGKRVKVYNAIVSESNGETLEKLIPANMAPVLETIDCRVLGILDGQAFFNVDLGFTFPMPGNAYDKGPEFTVSHYYTGSLHDAHLMRYTSNFKDLDSLAFLNVILPALKLEYEEMKGKLSLEDIALIPPRNATVYVPGGGKQTDTPLPPFKEFLSKLQLQEAEIYGYAWGLMVAIPDFSESSKPFRGKGFRMFIPFEEAPALWENEPAFDFLNGLSAKPTSFKGFNYFEIGQAFRNPRIAPGALEVMEMNHPDSLPLKLVVKHYQGLQDTAKHFGGQHNYEFTESGKLRWKQHTDPAGKRSPAETYYYDDYGKLLGNNTTQKRLKDGTDEDRFEFDEAGNLSERVIARFGSPPRYFELFYNGNHAYMMTRTFFGPSWSDVVLHISTSDKLCLNGQCYSFDASGRVAGMASEANARDHMQIGYDQAGRISEAHDEDDRYHYYYSYDADGRLLRYQQFEYQTPILTAKFHYEAGYRLPFQKTCFSNRSGSKSYELETYEWELEGE